MHNEAKNWCTPTILRDNFWNFSIYVPDIGI
jgi:hypothetical protein